MGRKNSNRGRNKSLTDFSDLINKPNCIKEENVDVNPIKTVEGNYEVLVHEKKHTKED